MKITFPAIALLFAVSAFGLTGPTQAQTQEQSQAHSGHDTMNHAAHMGALSGAAAAPTETGQSAFAAIAEITAILQANPDTDWDLVNIDALQAHLADMNAVTLHARVTTVPIDGGAAFEVTSTDPEITGSIRRMLLAHGKTMSGVDGLEMTTGQAENGARMTVTGPDSAMIRGLGFFGVLTLGMHHQAHHMALALGSDPHQ